jgi:hypothetical protein
VWRTKETSFIYLHQGKRLLDHSSSSTTSVPQPSRSGVSDYCRRNTAASTRASGDTIYKVLTPIIPTRQPQRPPCFERRAVSCLLHLGGQWSRVALCRAWERNHHISLVLLGTKAVPLSVFILFLVAIVLLDLTCLWRAPISPISMWPGRMGTNRMSLLNPLDLTVTILTRRHTADIHFSSKLPGNFHPRGQGKQNSNLSWVIERCLSWPSVCP